MKSFKKVYARETVATTENVRTFHLNNEEETEIEKEDTVMGNLLTPFNSISPGEPSRLEIPYSPD